METDRTGDFHPYPGGRLLTTCEGGRFRLASNRSVDPSFSSSGTTISRSHSQSSRAAGQTLYHD